ncbi:MAG: hypothetical protein ACK47B_25545 [Armatimonadota bacterium]
MGWVVDPSHERVRLYSLGEDGRYAAVEEVDGRLTSRVIQGFWLKPEWLWQAPRPGVLQCLREIGVLP